MKPGSAAGPLLILGVGNLLLSDEGVGVHVVRRLQEMKLPNGVELLDGGTGSFTLLEPMHRASRIILIDATCDGRPVGSVQRLQPRFSRDYPRTLTAHDIGLKDLLDTFHLMENPPEVVLYAISIAMPQEIGTELSREIAVKVDGIADMVLNEAWLQLESSRKPSLLRLNCWL